MVELVALPILAVGGAILLAVALASARDHLPRVWRERCRYGLTRHRPVKVITSARLLSVSLAGAAYAEVNSYHRCGACGARLNPTHPEYRPL